MYLHGEISLIGKWENKNKEVNKDAEHAKMQGSEHTGNKASQL